MKVLINGVEIDIKGGSRLTYDSQADTLSVDPMDVQKRTYTKRQSSKKDSVGDDAVEKLTSKMMTKEELKEKVKEIISKSDKPVAVQFITLACLGKGAKRSKQKYFKLLLQEMVEENEIVCTVQNNRSRYAFP